MSRSRLSRVPVVLAVLVVGALAGCDQSPRTAWAGPGWYLQLPYPTIAGGPSVYGGPYSYEKCEEDRRSRETPERYLCLNETKQPARFGVY